MVLAPLNNLMNYVTDVYETSSRGLFFIPLFFGDGVNGTKGDRWPSTGV